MALKLKAMKSAGVQCFTNPDTFAQLDATQATDLLTEIKVDPVRYMVWKKVQIEVNNKTKEKMKIVNVSAAKEEFIKVVKEEIMEFKDHIERVKNQYNQVKRLKEILPNNNVLVQMDFEEDYKCQSQDEIQSAYWNTTQVTIHPAVVYYKDDDNLKHKSFVFVSDEPGHNASTVYAILKKLIPEIKIIIFQTSRWFITGPILLPPNIETKVSSTLFATTKNGLKEEQLPGIILRRDTEKALATGLAELLKDLPMMQSSKRKSSYKTHKISSHGQTKPRALVR